MLADRNVAAGGRPKKLVSALLAAAIAMAGFAAGSGSASAAEPEETRLALALPMTVPPQPTGLISAEDLESYTAPTGILTRKLNAVQGRTVAIGLDPMIVASIRILGNTAPQSAISWLQRLQDADNEIFALSYADSDIAALSQAGSTTILGPTSFQIDPTLYPVTPPTEDDGIEATPTPGSTSTPDEPAIPTSSTLAEWPYTIDGLLWPRRNTATAADLTVFNAAAEVTTILSSGNVTATPRASAAVDGQPVLVSDEVLSDLLTQAVEAATPADWMASVELFAGELASRPASGTLLATFDRTSPEAVTRLAETIAAVTQLPGIQLPGLTAAMDEEPTVVRVADSPVDPERVSRVRLMLAAEALILPFSSVLIDPSPLTGERRLSLLGLSSNSWVDPTTVWTTSVDEWLERSNQIVSSVQIAESSNLNFGQERGNLPIAVSNGLDFPVKVYVTLRSETGILVVLDSRVPIELEPNSQARAQIPVQSIANGQASLQVSLSSESMVSIGAPKTVTANVAAGWETAATFAIAALLAIMFVAGIVRTVVKRRRALEAERVSSLEQGE